MVDAVVEYEYTGQEEDELTIKVGDIIKDVKTMDGGWWEGELNGKRGVFPDNFVKMLEPKASPPKKESKPHPEPKKEMGGASNVAGLASRLGKSIEQSIHGGAPPALRKEPKRRCRALFSYAAENEDELQLKEGDVVDIIKEEEPGWWYGTMGGKEGMFPSNFVEEVKEEQKEEAPPAEAAPEEKKPAEPGHKKVIGGVGLGNIFSGGQIHLRSTSNRPDKPTPAPAAEKPAPTRQNGSRKRADPPAPVKTAEVPKGHMLPKIASKEKPAEKANVLYDYTAQNEDELSFKIGDVVTVLDKKLEDPGWWRGEIHGKVGVFPDNFVDPIPASPPAAEALKPLRPAVADRSEPTVKPKRPMMPEKNEVTPVLPASSPPTRDGGDSPRKHEKPTPLIPPMKRPGPAVPSKKPLPPKPAEKPVVAVKNDTAEAPPLERLETHGQKLTHPTVSRPKATKTRPPSVTQAHPDDEQEHEENGVREASDKPHPQPIRPPAPGSVKQHSPVVAAAPPVDLEPLRRDIAWLKDNTVPKDKFLQLEATVQRLQHDVEDSRRSAQSTSKRLVDLMTEVDEEKKLRMGAEVEMARLKKLTAERIVNPH